MKILCGLVPLMMLVGCAAPPVVPPPVIETKLIAPDIAPELLDCGQAPPVPAGASMQSDVARYLVAVWSWGNECSSHLQAVKQSLGSAP